MIFFFSYDLQIPFFNFIRETNLISLDEDDLTISYFIQILLIFARIYLRKTQFIKNEISGFMQHLKCLQSDFLSHLMAESPFLKNLSIHLFSKTLNLILSREPKPNLLNPKPSGTLHQKNVQ